MNQLPLPPTGFQQIQPNQTRSCRIWFRTIIAAMALLVASPCLPTGASEPSIKRLDDSVAAAVEKILDQIMPFVKKNRYQVMHVGKFEGPRGTSAGPEVQTKFSRAIQSREGLSIDPIDYDLLIKGRIEQVKLTNALSVRIVVQLFDGNTNKPVGQFSGTAADSNTEAPAKPPEFSADVVGSQAVPRLLALPVALTGDEDFAQRNKKLLANLTASPYVVKGSEVFAAADSPYSMELLIKDSAGKYVPSRAEKQGRRELPFADVPLKQVFAVRLNNYSNIEAAANLTLDGISSFAFSKVRPAATNWLVPPATGNQPGSIIITGWDLDDQTSFEFQNVGYPESAMAELRLEPNEAMGQISVHFSESYQIGTAGSRAVGRGEKIVAEKKSVPRDLGPHRATIHIRYQRGE